MQLCMLMLALAVMFATFSDLHMSVSRVRAGDGNERGMRQGEQRWRRGGERQCGHSRRRGHQQHRARNRVRDGADGRVAGRAILLVQFNPLALELVLLAREDRLRAVSHFVRDRSLEVRLLEQRL